MSIPPFTTQDRQDLIRAVICFIMIVVCSILVGLGKIDVSVFIVVIAGVSGYYLGKSSSSGSIIP